MNLTDRAFTKEANLCVIAGDNAAFVEFRPDAQTRHGFAAAQLLHYKLEANATAARTTTAPPQQLTLAFSTADVVLTGWRLDHVADEVRAGRLTIVRPLPDAARYEQLDLHQAAVAAIEVQPFDKG